MSGYGFGKKPVDRKPEEPAEGEGDRLDLSGIQRRPVSLDPAREEAAIRRGDALGFVDRGTPSDAPLDTPGGARRRRRSAQPQISVYIKGPKNTLEWFIEYTNERGHRSYWETLEEFRAMIDPK
jgi:hypothetical protein